MQRHAFKLALLILALGCITPFLLFVFHEEIFWNWRSSAIEESKRRGETIMRAIAAYKKDNGHLPAKLDELSPGYIKTMPQPTAGGRVWRYRVTDNGESFLLAFGMPEEAPYYFYPKCTLDPNDGTWYLDE
jgi:hypothetical protein